MVKPSGTSRPGPSGSEPQGRWSRLVRVIQVLSPLAYMLFTGMTIAEMRHTNRLTERQQALTLRPILALQGVGTNLLAPGSSHERWLLLGTVVNMGPVPAQQVVLATTVNSDSANVELPRPSGAYATLAPQNGGLITVPETISKQEALAKLSENGALYFHVTARYQDQDRVEHVMRATAQLVYVEGQTLNWLIVGMYYD